MSQPAGFEPSGGQGPVSINGDGGTAPAFQQPIQYGQQAPQQQFQQPQQQFNGQQNGGAPYQQYLSRVPESLRGAIEPIFKDWDANYTRNMQQYAEQVRRYQPYEEFTQYDPQVLGQAVQLAQMVSQNPEEVFKLLANELNYDIDDEDLSGFDPNNPAGQYGQQGYQQGYEDPRIASMEEALSNLTEVIQQERSQRDEDQQTEQILNQLSDYEQTYGPMDYDFVLGKAYATGDLDGAVREFYQNYGQQYAQQQQQQQQFNGNGLIPGLAPQPQYQQQQQQPAMVEVGGVMVPANHPAAQHAGPPNPLGSGGGLPSDTQDLGKLSKKDRVSLVAQTLRAANQQAQG